MKMPCNKCSFSYTYPVGTKIKHSPNTNKDECRSCDKYRRYEDFKSGKKPLIIIDFVFNPMKGE